MTSRASRQTRPACSSRTGTSGAAPWGPSARRTTRVPRVASVRSSRASRTWPMTMWRLCKRRWRKTESTFVPSWWNPSRARRASWCPRTATCGRPRSSARSTGCCSSRTRCRRAWAAAARSSPATTTACGRTCWSWVRHSRAVCCRSPRSWPPKRSCSPSSRGSTAALTVATRWRAAWPLRRCRCWRKSAWPRTPWSAAASCARAWARWRPGPAPSSPSCAAAAC
mmetsp:Transcript_26042/g.82307  ORF Transcript_26042/g.82307 Transcript_26042/m.82307 type:complete len:225 (+) Transcript_26042:395-1069(+)